MVEIIDDRNGLEKFSSEWNRLAKPLENPLMTHEWFTACANSFYKDDDLYVVILRSGDNISAIAPIVVTRKRGIKWLELMGTSFLHEPCGVLYDSHDSLMEILRELIKLRRPVYLNRVPANTSTAEILRRQIKYRGIVIERNSSGTVRVPITSSWDEFYRTISSRRRYDIRLARRRAEEGGKVSFKIFCPSPDELDSYLKIAFEVEAAGWKGREGSALLFNHKIQKFFWGYAATACRDNILRLCFMKINNEVAAMQIAVEYARRFWVLKIGYDERWARCSPGIQLTNEAIRYSYDQGLKSYEFLGSDEPWLHIWSNETDYYKSIGVYPAALSGLVSLSIDLADYIRRKVMSGLYRKTA